MKLKPRQALNKSFLKIKPHRIEFDNFKKELNVLLNKINEDEREDHNKNFVRDFLRETFYKNNFVNSKGTTDLAIHLDDKSGSNVGVIIEAKRPSKTSEMITRENLNAKAMREVILYYLRERIEEKNDEIKNIIITNTFEWFIFDAQVFEKLFYKNTKLVSDYKAWNSNQKVSSNTHHFYDEIAKKHLEYTAQNIEFTYFDLRDYRKAIENKKNEKNLIPLLKIFSPQHLLKESFANDSNSLDKQFYLELLHIIGLDEKKDGSKKVIRRLDENNRISGSLLENTVQMLETKDSLRNFKDASNFGIDKGEQFFNIALELNILWINRILFLKLLEAQLVNYNKGNKDFKFLNPKDIQEYDDLFELFHQVLAQKKEDRKNIKVKFKNIPYLNSSLFEISDLERKTFGVDSLKDRFKLPIYKHSVFKKNIKSVQKEIPTLEYLFNFLEAYDFSSDVGEDIAEEKKSIINASVLGLIFEKLNGYKEGSYFTPGFITMYMAKETIRRAVIQKFEDAKGWKCESLDDLRDKIEYNDKEARAEANEIINSLKICDPAVGSGHFLVSSLNEILAIKSDLQILSYKNGNRIKDYNLTVENDELNIIDEDEIPFKYHLNEKGNTIEVLQKLQEAIFHEKEILIENCLFGVDINPNSVNICRLRLWIELLKNAYYTEDSGFKELETLPNIDINIKQGNSLINRFDLDSDISKALPTVKWKIEDYKNLVNDYKKTNDKELKRSIQNLITDIKSKITDQLDTNHPLNTKLKRLRKQFHDRFDTIDAFESDLTAKQKNELDKKKKKLEKDLEKAASDIIEFQEGEIYKQAFEWRFEFPEVLDEKGNYLGFDVVIGNPPYGVNFSNPEKKHFKLYFKDVHVRTPESFNYFIRRFTSISGNNSMCSLIIPSSFLNQIEFEKTRDLIFNEYSLFNIINLGDGVFDDVTTSTCILGFSKNVANIQINYADLRDIDKDNLKTELSQLNNKIDISQLKNNQSSSFIYRPNQSIINKCYKNKLPLKEVAEDVATGISSGLDKAYVFTQDVINEKEFEPTLLKKLVVGGEIHRFYLNPISNKSIIYITNESQIKNYPKIENELKKYRSKLELRREAANGTIKWYSLNWPRRQKLFDLPKILIRQTANNIIAAYDKEKWYCLKSGIILQLPEKSEISYLYLLSLLNSTLINYLYKDLVNEENRIFPEVKPIQLFKLPIKVADNEIQETLRKIVEQVIAEKKSNPNKDTSELESKIDELVYKLYGLTEEEIKIVEESVK